MMQRSARSPGDIAVIVVFAVLLLAPAVLALTGHAGFDTTFLTSTEHRVPFVAPPVTSGALATGGWERDVEREIADAFPLRKQLIQSYDYAKFAWLGDSLNNSVIRGRDGWLFLGREELRYLTDAAHPTDAELAAMADIGAARAAWCRRRGIRYIMVFAPNKSTIYPQYPPRTIVPVSPSTLERLLPMLRSRHVRTVDARPAVRAATRAGEVYPKGDTHWNDAGAYAAYRAIVAALHDAGVRDTIAASSLRAHTDSGTGDLYGLSGISDFMRNPWVHYDYQRRAHPVDLARAVSDPGLAAFDAHATVVDDPSLPKLVMFGDSFAEMLAPFLAEDFRRAVFLHHRDLTTTFDEQLVISEQPAVVIQELVERSLAGAAEAGQP